MPKNVRMAAAEPRSAPEDVILASADADEDPAPVPGAASPGSPPAPATPVGPAASAVPAAPAAVASAPAAAPVATPAPAAAPAADTAMTAPGATPAAAPVSAPTTPSVVAAVSASVPGTVPGTSLSMAPAVPDTSAANASGSNTTSAAGNVSANSSGNVTSNATGDSPGSTMDHKQIMGVVAAVVGLGMLGWTCCAPSGRSGPTVPGNRPSSYRSQKSTVSIAQGEGLGPESIGGVEPQGSETNGEQGGAGAYSMRRQQTRQARQASGGKEDNTF